MHVLRPLRVSLCAALLLTACTHHVVPPQPSSFTFHSYIDLQDGWRLRVVTPVLKSGKYVADFKALPSTEGAIELSAGDDFVGYETSYYRVRHAGPAGVSIEFTSAVVTIQGKESRKPAPMVRLFELPASARYVRLVFLTRVSAADHNQAILAAADSSDLERVTELVQSDPAANCKTDAGTYCEWVPQGIAVRAEEPDPAHRGKWIPSM